MAESHVGSLMLDMAAAGYPRIIPQLNGIPSLTTSPSCCRLSSNSCDLNHNGNMLLTVKRTFPISRLLPPRTLRPLGIFRPQSTISTSHSPTTTPASSVTNAPLSALPTTSLLRSLLLHSITSSPRTLELGMKVMLANLETIDKNFLLKWGVDKTFYVSTKPFRSFGWCSC